MNIKRIGSHGLKTAVVAAFAAVSSSMPALSHAGLLPTSHISLTQFAALRSAHSTALLHSHSNVVLPGTGSGALRLNNALIKQSVVQGFGAGQSYAINQAIGGAIRGGIITGNLAIYTGGTSGFVQRGISFSIGENIGPTNVSGNFLNFASVGTGFKTGVAASGAGFTPVGGTNGAFAKGIAFGGSGSQRAYVNLLNKATGYSAFAGETSIGSLGKVTGGQFVGELGQVVGANSANYTPIFFAFGNVPNASSSLAILTGTQTSYLQFGSVTRPITSGQLLGNFYYPGGFNYLNYTFALGASPFNKVGLIFPTSTLKNALFLAKLK